MTGLREAAQQALEALEWHYRRGHSNTLGGFRLKIDEKALRNLRAALAEPVQEPGCHVFNVTVTGRLHEWEPTTYAFALRDGKHALYTAPPKRKPLSDEEINSLWDSHIVPVFGKNGINPIVFTRAVEAAHGIKEES